MHFVPGDEFEVWRNWGPCQFVKPAIKPACLPACLLASQPACPWLMALQIGRAEGSGILLRSNWCQFNSVELDCLRSAIGSHLNSIEFSWNHIFELSCVRWKSIQLSSNRSNLIELMLIQLCRFAMPSVWNATLANIWPITVWGWCNNVLNCLSVSGNSEACSISLTCLPTFVLSLQRCVWALHVLFCCNVCPPSCFVQAMCLSSPCSQNNWWKQFKNLRRMH